MTELIWFAAGGAVLIAASLNIVLQLAALAERHGAAWRARQSNAGDVTPSQYHHREN